MMEDLTYWFVIGERDELRARVEVAEREAVRKASELADELEEAGVAMVPAADLDALVERVEVAERERDQWWDDAEREREQREKVEAERDRLREALQRIASGESFQSTPGVLDRSFSGIEAQMMRKYAREALTGQ